MKLTDRHSLIQHSHTLEYDLNPLAIYYMVRRRCQERCLPKAIPQSLPLLRYCSVMSPVNATGLVSVQGPTDAVVYLERSVIQDFLADGCYITAFCSEIVASCCQKVSARKIIIRNYKQPRHPSVCLDVTLHKRDGTLTLLPSVTLHADLEKYGLVMWSMARSWLFFPTLSSVSANVSDREKSRGCQGFTACLRLPT